MRSVIDSLNVHAKGPGSAVIGKLTRKKWVTVRAACRHWLEIGYGFGTGWVHKSFVCQSAPETVMINPRRELAAALRGAAGIPEDEVWHVATYCGAYLDEELAWAAREHLRTGVYPNLRARKQRAEEAAENEQRNRLEEVKLGKEYPLTRKHQVLPIYQDRTPFLPDPYPLESRTSRNSRSVTRIRVTGSDTVLCEPRDYGVAISAAAIEPRVASRWGGARRGAGRKPRATRRDPHRRRAPLASRHPCHVTLRVRKDVPPLRTAKLVAELQRSWREVRERGRFRLVHFSSRRSRSHGRRRSQRQGSRVRAQIGRRPLRSCRESSLSANGAGASRPLPRSRTAHSAGSPERDRVRLVECAPAPGKGRARFLGSHRSILPRRGGGSEAGASPCLQSVTRPPSRRREPGCSASAGAGSG